MTKNLTIYTIGHSTRPIDEFLKLLEAYDVELLVDVRTIAGSRHNPQYNEENLRLALEESGISYLHIKGLGGLRKTTKESKNLGWKNSSFRGYADYMQTNEFSENVDQLIQIANEKKTAIMCSEAVPWRCHRSLIGDALLVRKIIVMDIMSEKNCPPHKLTRFAKVNGLEITYPEESNGRD